MPEEAEPEGEAEEEEAGEDGEEEEEEGTGYAGQDDGQHKELGQDKDQEEVVVEHNGRDGDVQGPTVDEGHEMAGEDEDEEEEKEKCAGNEIGLSTKG